MYSKTMKYFILISTIILLISCSPNKGLDDSSVEDAIKATIIAQGVASTLTVQANSLLEDAATSSSIETTKPTILKPTSTKVSTPTPNIPTNTATPVPSNTPTNTATPIPSPTYTATPVTMIQYEDLRFEIKTCAINSANIVNCDFTILNTGQDVTPHIYGRSSTMYDDFGNEYPGKEIRVANYEGVVQVIPRLVSGITIEGRLTFENVSEEAQSVSLLSIKGSFSGGFYVEFRDIPLISEP